MRPQGIDHLGPLSHQKVAHPMQHQPALLLTNLICTNRMFGTLVACLADRLGVSGIVLMALQIGLHVSRRHQSNLVAERL